MCWSLRVYWTVLHNLLARFFAGAADTICNDECQFVCSCCFCSCGQCPKHKQAKRVAEILDSTVAATAQTAVAPSTTAQHDYVIVDDIDANYLQIEKHHIETEPYYRTIDRSIAEEMLNGREDGACLVRPYKERDLTIKYIVSIYAQHQFFHIFIRQLYNQQLYAIGQEKAHEKLFSCPSDIIDFYSYNMLQCTNKQLSLKLLLKPIL